MRLGIIAGCSLIAAAPAGAAGPPERASVRSVVKADARTGQLVRRLAVVKPAGTTHAAAMATLGLSPAEIAALVRRLAERYEVDPLLVQAIVEVESNFDPFAVSPKGAQGLMQLMPQTARTLAVGNAFSPLENIEGGVRHLKSLLEQFDHRLDRALAAYNAGAGAVLKHGGVPPYRETTEYVAKVGRKLDQARAAAARKERNEQVRTAQAHVPIEYFVDARGTVYIRTRLSP